MQIAVLLKQVPSTESEIDISEDGASIRTDDIKWVINPYDEFAVEEALRIREAHGGTVTVVSVGPERTVSAIRSALAMGADTALLIASTDLDGLDTARLLASALKTIPFDLIIAGQRAVDDDHYLVGPAVAEFLNIPMIAMVIRQEIQDGKIRCRRSVERGLAVVEAPLRMLFTTQRGLNEPRYASLPGILKAKKKSVEIETPADYGFNAASPTHRCVRVVRFRTPQMRKAGKMIEGESAEIRAAELVRLLHQEAKVI